MHPRDGEAAGHPTGDGDDTWPNPSVVSLVSGAATSDGSQLHDRARRIRAESLGNPRFED